MLFWVPVCVTNLTHPTWNSIFPERTAVDSCSFMLTMDESMLHNFFQLSMHLNIFIIWHQGNLIFILCLNFQIKKWWVGLTFFLFFRSIIQHVFIEQCTKRKYSSEPNGHEPGHHDEDWKCTNEHIWKQHLCKCLEEKCYGGEKLIGGSVFKMGKRARKKGMRSKDLETGNTVGSLGPRDNSQPRGLSSWETPTGLQNQEAYTQISLEELPRCERLAPCHRVKLRVINQHH